MADRPGGSKDVNDNEYQPAGDSDASDTASSHYSYNSDNSFGYTASESSDASEEPGPSWADIPFKPADSYYTREDPLIVEIVRRLERFGDGVILDGEALQLEPHELKVLHEALGSLKIPSIIQTEEGVQDPDQIEKRSPLVFLGLLRDVSSYNKEAMISMRDQTFEDYDADIPRGQLEQLLARWVEETGPSESDVEQVEEAFYALPIERDIAVRMERRRKRIVEDLKKTIGEMNKQKMLDLKASMLQDYRVIIADEDLTDLILQWRRISGIQIELLMSNGISFTEKEELLAFKETHKNDMPEHQFIDVFIRWVEVVRPSIEDVQEVCRNVKTEEICEDLVHHVNWHLVGMGYVRSLFNPSYKYRSYEWYLSPSDFNQLITKGSLKLCGIRVADRVADRDYDNARTCGIEKCVKKTHPCYTVIVDDNNYSIVDSEECAEGGLVSNMHSLKGQIGHSHFRSVIFAWLRLYDISGLADQDILRDGSNASIVRSYQSLSSSKIQIGIKIKDFMSMIISPDWSLRFYLMYDPQHED